ncbi:hypothetical protein K458DRAFT_392932 [Lentithecium fluviatile CBS 122367]|uniref:Ferric oxidoreductase domain-containing protein n=1 Tax=Lentithecium fluviatile CBS 122367 TaxID=1168545 RepID=A0A6G1IQR1_9PLEO|nr:hypothetical protein K458DRAFT_392932 [Lentithecium fluviatile CBS 122367]
MSWAFPISPAPRYTTMVMAAVMAPTHRLRNPVWHLEQYLAAAAVAPGVPAKWHYLEALEQVNGMDAILDYEGILMYRYSLILLVVGFAVPIALMVLSKLPLSARITIVRFHGGQGNPPKIGQAIYILGFTTFNIIVVCIGYKSQQPHPWGYDKRAEILAYAGYRTGEYAFALFPLTILFSGRNNILLWLTNWSHDTFMLLHSVDKDLPYWQWGIVSTVFICIMLVWSMLWMRRPSYEIFLIGHIIIAIFVLVGNWYHLVLHFGLPGTHEYWLYAASVVWGFDRLVCIVRIVGNALRRSTVTEVGPNHVHVEIPGIRFNGKPSFHGYVYLPTLSPLKLVKQSDESVVHDLDSVLQSVVDQEIRIGERLDLHALLRQEGQAGYKKVGVVAYSPRALCDGVRAIVSSLARHEKTRFELEVDQFGW